MTELFKTPYTWLARIFNDMSLSNKVKEIKPKLKIISMSGGGTMVTTDTASVLGQRFVDIFLKKPFARKDILEAITRLIH